MTEPQSRSRLHVMSPPILEAEEIPYDPALKGPGVMRLTIEFNRAEIDRLKARHPRGDLIRFIKQAALEKADSLAADSLAGQPESKDLRATD